MSIIKNPTTSMLVPNEDAKKNSFNFLNNKNKKPFYLLLNKLLNSPADNESEGAAKLNRGE